MASSLPTEIWTQIFEQLCVHCHRPEHAHGMPDFRLTDAREGKAALKALSLVSRDFRAMSQGILFHYFLGSPDGGDLNEDVVKNTRVPSFLRALIANPSLCTHVRMVTLFSTPYQRSHNISRQDLQSWVDASAKYHIQVPSIVTEALAGQPCGEEPGLFLDEPGPSAQLVVPDVGGHGYPRTATEPLDEVYKWLHVLTLNFVPQVTHLHLTYPLGSMRDFQDPPPTFSKVCEVTYDRYSMIEDVIESFACFPNLSSLWAPDFDNDSDEQRPVKGLIPMMNLRKLSICCIPRALSMILSYCPHIEDLECHVDSALEDEGILLLELPTHTKTTLRRLAWSSQYCLGDPSDEELLCTFPLREFERLEILEIDQMSLLLYSRILRAETLNEVLPKTIRILHIAFAREVLSQIQIARQLRRLACDRAVELPELSIIKVDDPRRRRPGRSSHRTLAKFMERTGVIGVMNDAGVELRIGKEEPWCGTCNRAILSRPPGPGNRIAPVTFQLEHEVFSLDDL